MKKNITFVLATLITLIGGECTFAVTDINNYPVKEQSVHSVLVDEETVPTLDRVEQAAINSTNSGTQLKSAKTLSEALDISLQKTSVIKGGVSSSAPVTVDDCVKTALANHPSIEYYKMNAEAMKTKIGQAWSAYFPKIGIDLNYSRNDMLTTAFAVPKQKYNMFYAPSITANMMLFDFGKTKAAADYAKKMYKASEDSVQMSINDVIFDVKQSYYNLLYAMETEKVYTDNVRDIEMHLEQAKAFYLIGTKAKIDVLTAEHELGQAKLNLIKAKNNVKLAYAKLNDSMGLPENGEYTIAESLKTRKYDIDFDNMKEVAYSTRPELLAAQKQADAAGLAVRAAKRAFLPDIVAFGSFTSGGVEVNKDTGYQIGGGLSYSGFNAMLLKKQADEAKAVYKRSEAELAKTKQGVYLEVKQAYIQFVNAKDSIPVAQLSMIQAKEQYDLAAGRYKVGLGNAIELKDAEVSYRDAQLNYYSVLTNYNVAAADLERVTGAPIDTAEKTDL